MIIDTSRFFWSALSERLSPIWNMYSQVKPLVMLPFNIWFFFVSLPFRFFFYASSFFYSTKKPITQVKQKIAVIKEEVNNTLPESLKSKAPIELRSRKPRSAFDEERPFHGFYAVDKEEQTEEKGTRRNSLSKKESPVQPAPVESSPAPRSDELETLRSKLAEMENQSKKTSEDKMKLEQQLEELGKKFESDETALSQVESERKRYKSLISVEQRKCFDFQQQIVELKNQLKREHDAALASKQPESKQVEGKKKASAPAPTPTPAPVSAPAQSDQHSAWHGASHTQDYTDLVAKAQREEMESGKTFSEVLKESIKPSAAGPSSLDKKDEFTVVGGADSNHHIFAPVSAV